MTMSQIERTIQTGRTAHLLGLTRKSVQRQAQDGKIPSARLTSGDRPMWIFDESAILALASERADAQLREANERVARLGGEAA